MTDRIIKVRTDDRLCQLTASDGTLLIDVLNGGGIPVSAPCGRTGACGKCRVRVLEGSFAGEEPDGNGTVRSCRAVVCGDAFIETSGVTGKGLTAAFAGREPKKGVCGAAVDIGTTTVAAAYLTKDGSVRYASALNPQSCYGADVISRIEASADGKLEKLASLIRSCIRTLLEELCGEEVPAELIVTGNATMLHLFAGVSPEGMGVYPFTPAFTDVRTFTGEELGLPAQRVTLLPSISAFVGADITAGIYALGLHKTDKKEFLADLGTNGELVFSDRGTLYCTSTAAGPALEGACIECGMGGVKGAIDKVFEDENGETAFTVIGGAEPVGICGAGITDTVALMLKKGVLDEYGYLEDDPFPVSGKVYISQKDVRQVQLAKSAVRSGIETLLDTVGISADDTDVFHIAGGLGFYLRPESAFTLGLLPRTDAGKIHAAGNTGLLGALLCIGSPEALEEMREICRDCRNVDLGGSADFNRRFTEHMYFDD